MNPYGYNLNFKIQAVGTLTLMTILPQAQLAALASRGNAYLKQTQAEVIDSTKWSMCPDDLIEANLLIAEVQTSKTAVAKDAALESEFNALAEQWYRDTRTMSFIRQKAVHPAYQKIIGMGKPALPFIFKELLNYKGDWIWALNAIAGEDPATGITNFRKAVDAWMNWGKQRGHIL